MAVNNLIDSPFPTSPSKGGTGVNNSTNTLTVNANSTINQDVSTSASPTFNNVEITTAILDRNANTIVGFTASTTAVNYVNIKNAATTSVGGWPRVQVVGPDSVIDLVLESKGTNGMVSVVGDTGATQPGILSIFNGAQAKRVVITVPSGDFLDNTITLPGTPSVPGDSMVNTGSGIFAWIGGYTSYVTDASTLTLTVNSTQRLFFTGTLTLTVVMPVVSTLFLGQTFYLVNNSSGVVTVQSSGANVIQAMAANTQLELTVIATSGTSAASWNAVYSVVAAGVSSITGTANQVTASVATGPVTLSLPATVQINTSLLDANSNTILALPAATTPVNYLSIANNSTGGGPTLACNGTDTDIYMDLKTKGAGAVEIYSTGTNPGRLNIFDSAVSGRVNITVPASVTNYTMTLPAAQGGNHSVMQNDGAGNLSWSASPTFNNVEITTAVVNSSAQPVLGFFSNAPAVNYITVGAQTTGNNPFLTSVGSDTNVGMNIGLQGTGTFNILGGAATGSTIQLWPNEGLSQSMTISTPTSVTAYGVVLPGAQGAVNTFMQNDGAGNLSWVPSGTFPLTLTTAAAGTTTLTSTSTYYQLFTGTLTQTLVLPVASTLSLGTTFFVASTATAVITVQSSGSNTVATVTAGSHVTFICILTSGTTAASWYAAM